MAEYINKDNVIDIIDNSADIQEVKSCVFMLENADVIERSKVDKAITEIKNELNSGLWNDVFCRGLKYALKIFKKI